MTARRVAVWALGTALLMTLAACGGGGSDGKTGGGEASTGCPVDALAKAKGPVTITFWHTQFRANLTELQRQIAAFEQSQDKVKVKLVDQTSYRELFEKYKAGLTSGDLPDLGQFEETTVQQLLDSESTVTVADCIAADHYDTSDYMPRALDYYTVGGKLRAMPWTVSNPVLLFDPGKLRAAGLDPDHPPKTFDELEAASRQIVDRGVAKHGMALPTRDWFMEFFYAKSGQSYVNNGGGRRARATAATLDNATGLKIWSWWKRMVDSGLALNTGATEGNFDHLLAIPAGEAAMTIDASGTLGPINEVLETGQYPGVSIAAGPVPSITGRGGVPVGDASLWISKRSSPAEQAAAWELVKFLDAPEQIAGFAIASGYVPIRTSAAESPEVQAYWAANPAYRVAYDQLLQRGGPAANGSVIGAYQGVRDAVRDALAAMLTEGRTPAAAVAQAQRRATAAIEDYNARLGL